MYALLWESVDVMSRHVSELAERDVQMNSSGEELANPALSGLAVQVDIFQDALSSSGRLDTASTRVPNASQSGFSGKLMKSKSLPTLALPHNCEINEERNFESSNGINFSSHGSIACVPEADIQLTGP